MYETEEQRLQAQTEAHDADRQQTVASLRSLAAEVENAPGDMPLFKIEHFEKLALLACGYTSREELIPGPSADYGEDVYGDLWTSPDGSECWTGELPKVLRSLDDAHRLLPPGWRDYWMERNPDGTITFGVEKPLGRIDTLGMEMCGQEQATAATEENARTAAALYARAAEMEG